MRRAFRALYNLGHLYRRKLNDTSAENPKALAKASCVPKTRGGLLLGSVPGIPGSSSPNIGAKLMLRVKAMKLDFRDSKEYAA